MTTDTILSQMSELFALYCTPFILLDEQGRVIYTEYRWKNEHAHQLYCQLSESFSRDSELELYQ